MMNHKSRLTQIAFLLVCLLVSKPAAAELQQISVLETSSTGKLIRVNLGYTAGLNYGQPFLLREGNKKLAAGRVIQVNNGNAILALMENYSEDKVAQGEYELLYGEPFDEANNLPDYVADRDNEPENPANEKFFTNDGKELDASPELDDDNYSPEISLRPRFPESRTYSTHNISLGVEMFRNRALITELNLDPTTTGYTTYTGYSLRYAYTFRSNYWLKMRTPALFSVEGEWGVYSFDHSFPASSSTANPRIAQVRVMPVGFNIRYLVEASKLFRVYPYIGYQTNVVSATNGDLSGLSVLSGGRLLGGIGTQLVMSETMDARVQVGTDGLLLAGVVKF